MRVKAMIDAKMTKERTSFHPRSSARMKTIWGLSLFSSFDFQKLFLVWPAPRKRNRERAFFILCHASFTMKLRSKDGCGWVAPSARILGPILIESESRPDGKYLESCFRSETKFQNVSKHKKCLETKLLWTKTYIPLGIAQLGQMGGSQSSPRMFGALIQSIYCVTSFLSIPIQTPSKS